MLDTDDVADVVFSRTAVRRRCIGLNLIGFVSGSDPPAKKGYDLKSSRFFLKEYSDTNAKNVAPAGGYKNPKSS